MINRRDFLKISAMGTVAAALPHSVMAATAGSGAGKPSKSANGKVNMGFIGLGQQAMYLMSSFINMPDVRVLAGCDVYDIKRNRFIKRVTDFYKGKGETKVKVDVYEDYKELLARPDIDAVVIATPDHWHALIAVDACKAGKDVYLEKPMTLTIYEGQMLCKAVRKYNRILQVGSQQRSSDEFLHFANLVREGELGKIDRVEVFVGRIDKFNKETGAPVPYTIMPKMDVPQGLNWDKWLGPLSEPVYYSEGLDPYITETKNETYWGEWRYVKPTGGGLMTDWGAHMFDIAQWAIGKDLCGPVEVIPPGYSYYDHLTYKYDNGIVMTEKQIEGNNQAVRIYGENGWVYVCRGLFKASDPKFNMKKETDSSVPFEARPGHHRVFVDSVLSRIDPNVPVEVGHSSCTVCNMGNIAMELNRPLKWNPIVQKFMNDEEATKLMHYQYRDGYKLEL